MNSTKPHPVAIITRRGKIWKQGNLRQIANCYGKLSPVALIDPIKKQNAGFFGGCKESTVG